MHHPIYAAMSTVASDFYVVLKKKKGHRSIGILRGDTTKLIVHSLVFFVHSYRVTGLGVMSRLAYVTV